MKNVWGLYWYVLCVAIVRVSTYPVNKNNQTQSDLEDFSTDYIIKDLSPVKFVGVDRGLENFDDEPIQRKNAKKPLILEPDAEMLPPNYKGVIPPGVDHMELVLAEPQVMATDSKAIKYIFSNQGVRNEKGGKKTVKFEKSLKGEKEKEKQKKDYAEAAGKKKAHTVIKNNFSGRKDQAFNEKGGSYEIEGNRNKGHNAAGFHNVYHKDEYKKDANFYDNDHQGGQFKKHGRYGEKHDSLERSYKKGLSHDSAFDLAEAKKEGKSKKSRVNEETQGHVAAQGYDGFFHNLDEFVKKVGLAKD
ncbi:uncharacterized protein LOC124426108 [Vespa crabro]|uniref:uncharacterized protein LOC124426108 n=1 Tax=Vespa crabro TaxID=7445 RepID=UPI001F025D62|nr:uncharacterized protein LOC124426108 [Vespa crabro]